MPRLKIQTPIPTHPQNDYQLIYLGKDNPGQGVTQTILGGFINCRQWAALKLNKWSSTRTSFALQFGNAWHWALEVCYDALREQGAVYEWADIEEEFALQFDSLNSRPEDTELALAFGEAMYNPYWEFWADDWEQEWEEVESEFDVLFVEPGYSYPQIRLRGKCDGLVRRKGKLWLLETKTCSQLGRKGADDALCFNFQNLTYLLAARLAVKEPIVGVLYNQCRKPQLRVRAGETRAEFTQRLIEDVAARPAEYFRRMEITYSQKRQERFAEEFSDKISFFQDWVGGAIPTFKNELACCGKWNCEFLPICASNSMAGFVQRRGGFFPELLE